MVPALIYPPVRVPHVKVKERERKRRVDRAAELCGGNTRACSRSYPSTFRIAGLINRKKVSHPVSSDRLCRSFTDSSVPDGSPLLNVLYLSFSSFHCSRFSFSFSIPAVSPLFLFFVFLYRKEDPCFRCHVCRKVRESAHLLFPSGSRVQL